MGPLSSIFQKKNNNSEKKPTKIPCPTACTALFPYAKVPNTLFLCTCTLILTGSNSLVKRFYQKTFRKFMTKIFVPTRRIAPSDAGGVRRRISARSDDYYIICSRAKKHDEKRRAEGNIGSRGSILARRRCDICAKGASPLPHGNKILQFRIQGSFSHGARRTPCSVTANAKTYRVCSPNAAQQWVSTVARNAAFDPLEPRIPQLRSG